MQSDSPDCATRGNQHFCWIPTTTRRCTFNIQELNRNCSHVIQRQLCPCTQPQVQNEHMLVYKNVRKSSPTGPKHAAVLLRPAPTGFDLPQHARQRQRQTERWSECRQPAQWRAWTGTTAERRGLLFSAVETVHMSVVVMTTEILLTQRGERNHIQLHERRTHACPHTPKHCPQTSKFIYMHSYENVLDAKVTWLFYGFESRVDELLCNQIYANILHKVTAPGLTTLNPLHWRHSTRHKTNLQSALHS